MELARISHTSLNLTSEMEVLLYNYVSPPPIEVLARVDLANLAGAGGNYTLNFYLNGVQLDPPSTVVVPAGKTTTVMASRPFPTYSGDSISVRVIGLSGDAAVNTLATLRDATPLKSTDIFGTGPTAIDNNYGDTNALTYKTSSGVGIAGATIFCYLTADYNAGNRGQGFLQGRTATTTGGIWQSPLFLNPGSYTLIFFLPGQYGPDVVLITV